MKPQCARHLRRTTVFKSVQRLVPTIVVMAVAVHLFRKIAVSSTTAFSSSSTLTRRVHFDKRCSSQSNLVESRRVLRSKSNMVHVQRRADQSSASSKNWILPSVDKDTSVFVRGIADAYAWVQSGQTVYLFAPMPADALGDGPPPVQLSLKDEGTKIRLSINGVDAVNGELAHQTKAGSEIWMVEDAPDGTSFVVVEIDKVKEGREWKSFLQPQVDFVNDYANLNVTSTQSVSSEQQEQAVQATLQHLQDQNAVLKAAPDGHKACAGDVLTIDMEGFELGPDSTRGKPLEMGAATGMKLNLGASGTGLPAEVHNQLIGIALGESRDVQATLGRRAGQRGGQQVILAVSCQKIQHKELPELGDEFARAIKRQEHFRLAGTEAGIPEEEAGLPETFTLDQLKAEIASEVAQQAEKTQYDGFKQQLIVELLNSAKVTCDWATLPDAEAVGAEELATVVDAMTKKEGLHSLIDMDAINRETWAVLGTPKNGERVAEVGDDPAREFETAHEKVLRSRQLDLAVDWLAQRVDSVDMGAAA